MKDYRAISSSPLSLCSPVVTCLLLVMLPSTGAFVRAREGVCVSVCDRMRWSGVWERGDDSAAALRLPWLLSLLLRTTTVPPNAYRMYTFTL